MSTCNLKLRGGKRVCVSVHMGLGIGREDKVNMVKCLHLMNLGEG